MALGALSVIESPYSGGSDLSSFGGGGMMSGRDSQGTATLMSPMSSMVETLKDIRDGIDNLIVTTRKVFTNLNKQLAYRFGTVIAAIKGTVAPSAKDMIGDADTDSNIGKEDDDPTTFTMAMEREGGFAALKKALFVGLVGVLLFFGKEIKPIVVGLLKVLKVVYDIIGPKGSIILGLLLLARLKFPKSFAFAVQGAKNSMSFLNKALTEPGFVTGFVKKGFGKVVAGAQLAMDGMKNAFTSVKNFFPLVGKKFMLILKGTKTTLIAMNAKFLFIAKQIGASLLALPMKILKGAKLALVGLRTVMVFMSTTLLSFITTTLIPAIVAFGTFLTATVFPAIVAGLVAVGGFLAAFAIPIAIIAGIAAAVAVVIFGIKKGIEAFKSALEEGDSLFSAIVQGIGTALLSIALLPVTLFKKLLGWVAGIFGFDNLKAKLEEFNPVELIMNGIKKLFSGIGNFIASIFSVDAIKEKIGKAFDIIGKIVDIFKGLAKGGIAAIGAILPGGESPKEAFTRVYEETIAGSNSKVEGSSPGLDRAMGEDAIQAEYQAEKDAEFGPAMRIDEDGNRVLATDADGTYSGNFSQTSQMSGTVVKNKIGLALMSMTDAENYAYVNADEEEKKALLARKIKELDLQPNDIKLENTYDNQMSFNDRLLRSNRTDRSRAQFEENKSGGGNFLSSIVSMFTGGSSDVNNSKLVSDQKNSSTTIINNNNNNINQNTDNSVSNSSMVNKVSIDHNDQTAAFLSSSGSAAVAEY